MSKRLPPPLEPAVAAYMTQLHQALVPVFVSAAVGTAKRIEVSNMESGQLRCAFGAACMSAFLEAAQRVAERCGMSRDAFAQGLRIHADEIEEERSFEPTPETAATRH